MYFFFFKFFNVYLFLRQRETEHEQGEGQKEGHTESETGSRLWAVSTEPNAGLELTDREIMTWAEVGRLTNQATQAPQAWSFNRLMTKYEKITFRNIYKDGVHGWLRSWSHDWWVRALCQALCWQLRAWNLLWILCLPLSLSLPRSCSLSVSKINKH